MTHFQAGVLVVEIGIIAAAYLIGLVPWKRTPRP